MSLISHFRALLTEKRNRAARWLLGHRVRARHPSLRCDSTTIWDYPYHDLDILQIGRGVAIAPCCEILARRKTAKSEVTGGIILGDGCVIGTGSNLRAAGGTIRIGRETGIGQQVTLVAANHRVERGEIYIRSAWDESRTGIDIGDNVWIGAHCVILAGTRIGNNSVIAAGAVVRGDVPAGEIWGGVPARRIREV